METTVLGKRKRQHKHPYLSGNFAPIRQTCPLTPCSYTGTIPEELAGGQYVRNGANPASNEDLGREAHWFDGDGMLSGVLFRRQDSIDENIRPEFVNQYILTDLFLAHDTLSSLRKPIAPSIATLVNPLSSLLRICLAVFRTIFLAVISRFPGSDRVIKKISVANTSILYHDGRALATCESGPPMRVSLPSLETIGWYNGKSAENETKVEQDGEVFGGDGLLSFVKEWTTAHPKVDPDSNEMILFHSMFAPPYVHYSVVPATQSPQTKHIPTHLLNLPVPGISSAKMMHDFGVSKNHTVIMDLPLSLDPLKLMQNKPIISYDGSASSRFGVFPRRDPARIRWFETSACCIFHTVNTWDVYDSFGNLEAVNMLVCRMNSAAVVFTAGDVAPPQKSKSTMQKVNGALQDGMNSLRKFSTSLVYERGPVLESSNESSMDLLGDDIDESVYAGPTVPSADDDQCCLYYFSFSMKPGLENTITHQFALAALPYEFPSTKAEGQMSEVRYVYGCTSISGTFNPKLGRATSIDALIKIDAKTLIARGKADSTIGPADCVDKRSVAEVLASDARQDKCDQQYDCIQVFQTPPNVFAQEPRFVPARDGSTEDNGYLLAYMFDESQLTPEGDPPPSAMSELWIIDAKGMKDVLAKIHLPQRVPYGLHGNWFPEWQVLGQRPISDVRKLVDAEERSKKRTHRISKRILNAMITAVGG